MRYYILWLLHKCVARLFLTLHPSSYTYEFHNLTYQWLNGVENKYVATYSPKDGVGYRRERLIHYKVKMRDEG